MITYITLSEITNVRFCAEIPAILIQAENEHDLFAIRVMASKESEAKRQLLDIMSSADPISVPECGTLMSGAGGLVLWTVKKIIALPGYPHKKPEGYRTQILIVFSETEGGTKTRTEISLLSKHEQDFFKPNGSESERYSYPR